MHQLALEVLRSSVAICCKAIRALASGDSLDLRLRSLVLRAGRAGRAG